MFFRDFGMLNYNWFEPGIVLRHYKNCPRQDLEVFNRKKK